MSGSARAAVGSALVWQICGQREAPPPRSATAFTAAAFTAAAASMDGQNLNPTVYDVEGDRDSQDPIVLEDEEDLDARDPFTAEEVFDMVRGLRDPEHEEMTLEQLRVAKLEDIRVDESVPLVEVKFTPTIPHCSMATLIGLCLSVKLLRSLPPRFKVDVSIAPGTHASEHEINKQLADKERVYAALENPHLLKVVNKCVADTNRDLVFAHDTKVEPYLSR